MIDSRGSILIVDDEANAVKVLSAILSKAGYKTAGAESTDRAINMIHEFDIDTIITDLKMPGRDGIELFEYVRSNFPDIPVIFLTAYGTVESAVNAMTCGAFYYFIKPPDYPKLMSILDRAVEQKKLKRELAYLRSQLNEGREIRILGKTPGIQNVIDTIEAIKNSESSVLIQGETGTGKELIARLLHYKSIRKDKPFVAVNCASIPKELIESELFGYEKGAFTGAFSRRIGRFEEAEGGTIFLDEIGELEMSLQAKLLRVLQEKEIERLGSNKKIKVNFRLVSSTNRDLSKGIREGWFREDLYYRINVVEIKMPPLRDRKDDIPLLVSEFIKEFSLRENKIITVPEDVMNILNNYHWPGNIRQLKNVIERAVVICRGDRITMHDLPDELKRNIVVNRVDTKQISPPFDSVLIPLRDLELEAVKEALKLCNGNKSKAAKMLGISRKALYKRLSVSH
ncbi:MAG: sigma-54-dependent transcriptional regulator [Thermodesulfovibrionales bacterium]